MLAKKTQISKKLFFNVKLLSEQREENVKWFLQERLTNLESLSGNFFKIHRRNLKKLANFFKL